MAAVTSAILCTVKAGDHVVASRATFSSCQYVIETVLPRYGVSVSIIDGSKLENWQQAITTKTRLVFFETPTNPTLEMIDIEGVCKLAHHVGACVIVDKLWARMLLSTPLPNILMGKGGALVA